MRIDAAATVLKRTIMIKYSSTKGFTLVELLIVISVISILSGLILTVVNPAGLRQKFRDGQRVADLKRIQSSLELYFMDNRRYPNAAAYQGTWFAITASTPTELAGYISPLPIDPGSNTYYYRTVASGATYSLSANLELNSSITSYCAATSGCQVATNCCIVTNP